MNSTHSSSTKIIDMASRERMASPVADVRIGHNNPPADLDMARAYRWAICKSELSPTASLIAHTIGVLFDDTGSPVWPSIRWISEHSRIPIGTVKYYMPEVRGWRDLAVGKARGRRGNTYKVNVDVDMVRAEYAAWEEDRCRLAGQPSYPSDKAAGQSAYPPKPQNAVAGQSSYPPTPSRITNSENPPVAGQQNPVAGQPGLSATKTKKESKQASDHKNGSTVAPLSDDADWTKQKLEPFGLSGLKWAQRLKVFLKCDLEEAVGEMDMLSDRHGPLNVVDAIQDVLDVTDIRTTPKKVLRSYVTSNTNKHGRRLMPKEMVESKIRILPMSERCFK